MKLSTKIILPIILISALLILLAGCTTPDEEPGYTPGTITGIIASPCCITSGEPVSEPCCVSPEYWCFYCQQTWSLQEGIEVVLTYGEDKVATVFTNEDGEFTFTNVPPGKNYVVTAYCPDFADNRPLVKDVALELIEGGSFDTNITDLVSTSLGLVVDFLVLYTDWGPEDISLDEVLADRPNFPNFPKFLALIYEVRRVVENCEVNLLTDDDVQYATCRAAEEISGLEIGCGPGATEGEGECEDPIAEAGGPYSATVCPETDALIDLTGSGTGTGTLTYDWDFGDGSIHGTGSSPSHTYKYPFNSPYSVTLTVTDDCGSTTATTTVTITESDSLEANAGGPYSEEVCPGYTATIAFDSTIISGTGPFTYAWNFGDTGSSTEADPSHTYPVGADTYDVILVVTDKCDKVEAKTTVTITECINTAPKVDGLPTRQAISGESYGGSCIPTYEFTLSNYVTDDEGNDLTYSFVGSVPTGMTIDLGSGEIVWDPVCGDFGLELKCPQCGTVCIKVRVQDDGCCQPSYTDVVICIEVWNGLIDGGGYVGIGFDGCPIGKYSCP